MDLSEYLAADATTLAGRVAEKDVTAVELLALARQRCGEVNAMINAVVTPLVEVADDVAQDHALVTRRFLDAGLMIGRGRSGHRAAAAAAAGADDGGGSVRIPAACNGLVGLKTSRGLSPYGPQSGEVMFEMVTQGVVSRTV